MDGLSGLLLGLMLPLPSAAESCTLMLLLPLKGLLQLWERQTISLGQFVLARACCTWMYVTPAKTHKGKAVPNTL
jgi:hypothetical protein